MIVCGCVWLRVRPAVTLTTLPAADLSRRVSAAFPSAHNGPDAVWEEVCGPLPDSSHPFLVFTRVACLQARTATTLNLELADAKVALAMQTYDLVSVFRTMYPRGVPNVHGFRLTTTFADLIKT